MEGKKVSRLRLLWSTTKNGFTLLELVFSMMLTLLMGGVLTYSYLAILKGWDDQTSRTIARSGSLINLESVTRDLRLANSIQVDNNQAIRFQVKEGNVNNSYAYYFSSIPGSNAYELRKTPLVGGINGAYAPGSGFVVVPNIMPPPTSTMTLGSSGRVVMKVVTQDRNNQFTLGTQVKIRNLPV